MFKWLQLEHLFTGQDTWSRSTLEHHRVQCLQSVNDNVVSSQSCDAGMKRWDVCEHSL